MKLKKYLFVLMLLSAQLYGQESKNMIRLSPLRLVDYFNPGLELSYERAITQKHSLAFSFTYLNHVFQIVDDDNLNGFKLGTEFKWFRESSSEKLRYYFSANLVYNNSTYTSDSRFVKKGDTLFKPLALGVDYHRQSLALNGNFGLQRNFSKNWLIDISVGIGGKCNVVHLIRKPDENIYAEVMKTMIMIKYSEGWLYLPNAQFQCTLGYRF